MIHQASVFLPPISPSPKCRKVKGEGEDRGAGAHAGAQARIGNQGYEGIQGDRPAARTLEGSS